VKGGLVTNPALRVDAIERVLWTAHDNGLGALGILASPILGTHGNAEYLVHLAPARGTDPSEWTQQIAHVAGGR
jgi:23S rRNA (cytidine1920-2'-O)/16S rRNA (cytidine1409-2'-O)-methyltransferase